MTTNKKRATALAPFAIILLLSSCAEFRAAMTGDKGPQEQKKSEAKAGPQEDKGKPKEGVGKAGEDQSKVLEDKVKMMEGVLRALREKTGALERDLASVKSRNDAIYETVTNPSYPAKIDTTARDFAVAKNLYGSFLIACDGLAPYLTGYEVRLAIGNLTDASFDGFKLKIKWGDRTSEFKKTTAIPPGTWTKVNVILTPAQAESVRKISVYLEMEDVILKKQK